MEKILFLGGDKRTVFAFNELKSKGYPTDSSGLFKGDNGKIESSDILVLPVPTTKNGTTVYCPLTDKNITLDEVKIKAKDKLILSCGYSFENCNNVDFLTLDAYSYLNAVPTAEGAIAFTIDNTPFTLWKSRVLITGNGRVSKILKSRLSGFGCDITVSARRYEDFSYLDANNTKYIKTADIKRHTEDFDIIFNTLDIMLFPNPEVLRNKYLIDLSSSGCTDFSAAKSSGINAFKLPGIPGKTAPETAGKIIASTVIKLIDLKKEK